jgi:hypothetical protein
MIVQPSHNDRPTVNRHATITDGPIVSAQRADNKMMRVERVKITYQYSRDSARWVASKYCIDVSGYVLKKDGSNSLMDATVRYYREQPYWLIAIVEALRPTDIPVLYTMQFELEA